MNTERWAGLVGWPYEVSDLGRVRRTGRACGVTVGQVLKQTRASDGYMRVGLRRNSVPQRTNPVHRLVLEAFVGPAPEGHNANHKNGDKTDNRLENLEWVTRSENQKHAYRLGLQGRGERHGMAKLTEEQVKDIRHRYAVGGVSQQALADEYGVNQTLIGFIVRRVVWTHVAA